jgi:hypothetical protein
MQATREGVTIRNFHGVVKDMSNVVVETELFPAAALSFYTAYNLNRTDPVRDSASYEAYYSAARGGGQGDYRAGINEKIDNVVDCLTKFPLSKRAVRLDWLSQRLQYSGKPIVHVSALRACRSSRSLRRLLTTAWTPRPSVFGSCTSAWSRPGKAAAVPPRGSYSTALGSCGRRLRPFSPRTYTSLAQSCTTSRPGWVCPWAPTRTLSLRCLARGSPPPPPYCQVQ